jgi:hypothetical protein
MTHRKLDFINDIKIDEGALELEWLEHPRLYLEYCEASAEATRRAKEAYHAQKVKYAELMLMAADELTKLNQKVNDSTRDAWVLLHPEYDAATRARHQAEYEADQLQNAVYAFGHRKDALEHLCALDARGYYSRCREPRNLTPEVLKEWRDQKNVVAEKEIEGVRTGIRDNLNRTRRTLTEE